MEVGPWHFGVYSKVLEKIYAGEYNYEMEFSVVIPAFEESKKIRADVEAAADFLQSNRLTGEIIVVDDGSTDDTASAAGKGEIPSAISLRVIRHNDHRGKGYAVRSGMVETSGEYVMFADSGCCVPYGNVLVGLQLLKSGAADIAHASRKLAQSRIVRPQSLYRRICARIFRLAVGILMGIDRELTDTQCGFKIYRGEVARQLYSRCITDGFMFDLEIIMRAQRQGCVIKEFPVEWTCDRDSRLSPSRTWRQVLRELMTIKRIPAESKTHTT